MRADIVRTQTEWRKDGGSKRWGLKLKAILQGDKEAVVLQGVKGKLQGELVRRRKEAL